MRKETILCIALAITGLLITTGCQELTNEGRGIDIIDATWIEEPLFEMIQRSSKGTLTFKEQEEMLPLLAEMGIKTIYLTPIWKYKPGTPLSRYYILDYYEIDPAKGTEEDFKHFIETTHSYGIKVILDLVTAHTGPGRYIYENHKDWILRDKYGNLVYCWPHKQWGYAVDRANPEVIEHFTEIARYYVEEFGVDGYRMDAIGTQYCNETISDCSQPVEGEHHSKLLLKSIKSAIGKDKALYLEWAYLGRLYVYNAGVKEEDGCPCPNPIPCSMILPELNEYGDASYSYEFGRCFLQDMIKGEATSEDLVNFFKEECLYYGKARGRFLMTHDFGYEFYSSHPELHKVGAVLITTVPGFPHIYHREIFPLGGIDAINEEVFNLHKKLLSIRGKFDALKKGSIENIWKEGDNAYAYMREYGNEKVFVVLNFQAKEISVVLDMPVENGSTLYDLLNDGRFIVNDSTNFQIHLPAYGARLLTLEDEFPPLLSIEKPRRGYFHILDKAMLPIGITIILGKITIIADAYDENGIEKVEFYIDNVMRFADTDEPYSWLWDEFVIGWHEIRVVAYDNSGNEGEDEIDVIIFNWG